MKSDSIRPSPELSILIVCFNGREVIEGCLRSLRRVRDEADFEVIVIDNASRDGSVEWIRSEFPEVRLIALTENLGFAAGLNRGFSAAGGGIVLALNPDTLMPRRTLPRILDFLRDKPSAGVVGATLTYTDGEPQDSTFQFPSLPREFLNYLPELKTILRPRQALNGLRRIVSGYAGKTSPFHTPAISGAAFAV
ncbi:MAG: glycosyltransferase, partial [bacterium]|nr:glycosyltransferase [bacterium]